MHNRMRNMKSYIVEGKVDANSNILSEIIKNSDIILSYIPYQVERGRNEITLRFSRFLLFSFKDKFRIEGKINTKGMSAYTLESEKKNKFEIFITIKEERDQNLVGIAVKYSGEKEWIVDKYLREIGESILNGIKEEIGKVATVQTTANFSEGLGKLSFITKLLMKSRLAKTDEIEIKKGQFISIISDLIQQFLRYQLIYVSGSSENESFRILFVGGDVRGVYVNMNGEESFNEKSLNEIEGHFKVNIYVSLEPEAILRGVTDESA